MHGLLTARNVHHKTGTSAIISAQARGPAAVALGNRQHQCQTQAHAAIALTGAAAAVKGFKNACTLGYGYARASVADLNFDRVARSGGTIP